MATSGIFIIDSGKFENALDLGLYPALAYLVLARGTQGNNSTTSWSANAMRRYLGLRFENAKTAMTALIDEGLIHTIEGSSATRPRYSLGFNPDTLSGDKVFLPNPLVDGIEGIISPLRRVRETQNKDVLELLMHFYQFQHLDTEHGINRDWLSEGSEIEHITNVGNIRIWRATESDGPILYSRNELALNWENRMNGFSKAFDTLLDLGLIEMVWYVTDSGGELLYPVTCNVEAAIDRFIEPIEAPPQSIWGGDWTLVTQRHQSTPNAIGLFRTKFRLQHSQATGEWERNIADMEQMVCNWLKNQVSS